MGIIKNSDIRCIINDTLNFIDKRLIEHGEKVAYTYYKLLKYSNEYDEYDILRYCFVACLHDIGAYKTEEIDNMVKFETNNIFEHSIYGYLFIKYFSPWKDCADIILYHHMKYDDIEQFGCNNEKRKQLINLLHLSDRIDIILNHIDDLSINTIEKYFTKGRFSERNLNILFEANKEYNIIASLKSEKYKEELESFFNQIIIPEKEKEEFLRMLTYTIDFRSEYTVIHTIITCYVSDEIAKFFNLNQTERYNIHYGTLLHDLGKISTPLDILEKDGKLNDEEMKIMKEHVIITEQILSNYVNDDILKIASRHHEKLDGSGYPRGLCKKDLSFSECIVAVADMFSALNQKRSYKESFPKEKIISILINDANNNKISKVVVDKIINHYDQIIENVEIYSKESLRIYKNMMSEYNKIYAMFKEKKCY